MSERKLQVMLLVGQDYFAIAALTALLLQADFSPRILTHRPQAPIEEVWAVVYKWIPHGLFFLSSPKSFLADDLHPDQYFRYFYPQTSPFVGKNHSDELDLLVKRLIQRRLEHYPGHLPLTS